MANKDRVLIVDDEKNIVGSLQDILKDEGYEINTAEDGLDALEMVQNDPPDLILLDIWIPGMDGIEVLRTIKTYYPEIEVLVMSGHGTIDTAVKATKLGAYDFIEKPFSLDQIVRSVGQGLQKKHAGVGNNGHATQKHELPHCFQMMVDVKKSIKHLARSARPVLVQGDAGTGKEFIAQAIHHQSRKANMPFVKLNCGLRPANQVKSELFAAENTAKGKGRKKLPSRSHPSRRRVVYLKNIEALAAPIQERLAECLNPETPADVAAHLLPSRIFASTLRDLEEMVAQGEFNADLYDILKEHTVYIPPVKEHAAIIPSLVTKFFEEQAERGDMPPHQVSAEAMDALSRYEWPENLKEMRSVLEQLSRKVHPEDEISINHLPPEIRRVRKVPAGAAANGNGHHRQRTLKRSVVLCGSGLHSGIKTGLIMQPLPPGSGIIFGDISSGATIPARLENVQSTEYATCLRKGKASVATIEHIMAVLHMYRINNLLIKIGDEAPVMDGSAKDFCQLVEDGEFEDQDDTYEELVIDKKYVFGEEGSDQPHISIEPYDGFKVSYHMEYPDPIGVMDHTFDFKSPSEFKTEIAPARTFGFMKDVAMLMKMGFAAGGNLDNFILLDEKKVLNTELRYENEFARHKILDILGDFYLLGKPVRGHIRAHKSGHTQNIGLLKQIQAAYS